MMADGWVTCETPGPRRVLSQPPFTDVEIKAQGSGPGGSHAGVTSRLGLRPRMGFQHPTADALTVLFLPQTFGAAS